MLKMFLCVVFMCKLFFFQYIYSFFFFFKKKKRGGFSWHVSGGTCQQAKKAGLREQTN